MQNLKRDNLTTLHLMGKNFAKTEFDKNNFTGRILRKNDYTKRNSILRKN